MADSFSDLPDALVRDLLAKAVPVAEQVSSHLQQLCSSRSSVRDQIGSKGLIARKADLDVPREPSIVGIDGSYQIHRLTAMDLCAAAAVAVEGTSKEARRYWQEPYHRMWVDSFEHSKDATNTLRGLMISMELDLAVEAPHDLVLLDGSFIILLIYLNQGLTSYTRAPAKLAKKFLSAWNEQKVLDRFLDVLQSARTVAVPKYSARNELASMFHFDGVPETDGKTIATIVLEPDEYTVPLPIYRFGEEDQQYHLPREFCSPEIQVLMNKRLEDMRVVFYRPFGWASAVRLEIPAPLAASSTRLSIVLEGIKRQFFSPAVTEPYPLFLADRMVKSLGAGVAVIEQTIAQQAVAMSNDIEATLLCLHSYRTESGRGG